MRNGPTKWQRIFLYLFALSLPVSISGAETAVLLSATLLLLEAMSGLTRSPLFPLPLFVPLFVFLLGHVVSSFAGPDARQSLWSIDWIFITMPVTLGAMRVIGNDRRPVLIFLTVGTIVALYAIAQSFWGIDLVRPAGEKAIIPYYGAEGRYLPIGTFCHHLTYAHLYQFVFLFILTFAVRHLKDRRHLVVTVPASIVVGLSLLFSYSRGVWVSITVGALLIVVLSWGKRWGVVALAGIAVAAMVISRDGSLGDRLESITSEQANAERLTIYRIHWDAIRDHPVYGIGPGRYQQVMPPYYDRYEHTEDMPIVHAHNDFLQVWLNAGLIGLFGFIWLNVAFLRRVWVHVRSRSFRTPFGGTILVASFAGVVAFLISGLTQYNLGDSEVALGYWFVMGLALWEMDGWRRRRDLTEEPF